MVNAARDSESTRTVERSCLLLNAMAGQSVPLGLTQLSERTGLAKSSIGRILQSLEGRGLVVRDGRKCRLGPGLLLLSLQVQERLVVRAEASPYLHRLRDMTGETASFYLAFDNEALLVERAVSLLPDKSLPDPGHPIALHIRPAGRVMLALESPDVVAAYLENQTDPAVRGLLQAHLRTIAGQGYDLEDDGREVELAFPLANFQDAVLGAIALTGPRERWSTALAEEFLGRAREQVADLARTLRYLEPLRLK